jgi:predicted dehydrogenase
VGLIGCGWISQIAHIPNLLASHRADLVALADLTDMNRADAMRLAPAARAYRDAAELLADSTVEAVVIATPPAVAASLARDAFAAGKHVLLEKPGATSLGEAERVRDAWQPSGRIGVVGYNFRRNPAVEAAHAALQSGRLGDLVAIHSVFTWAAAVAGSGWRDLEGSGGVLLDLGCHHIELATHLAGAAVTEARAVQRSIARPDDTADISLGFDNGVVASIHVSSCEGRNTNAVRLFGRAGHMDLDLVRQRPPRLLQGDPPRSRLRRAMEMAAGLDGASLFASGSERSFASLLDAFLRGCLENHQPSPSIDDAVAVFRAVEMARAPTS